MKTRRLKGLTIVELIITIAILAILTSLILLNTRSFNNYLEKKELKSIVIIINQTKNYALSTRERQSISFSNKSYKSSVNNEEVELEKLEFLPEESNTSEFIFTENARPAMNDSLNPTAGTMTFKGKDKSYKVILRPVTGKIRIEEKWRKNTKVLSLWNL